MNHQGQRADGLFSHASSIFWPFLSSKSLKHDGSWTIRCGWQRGVDRPALEGGCVSPSKGSGKPARFHDASRWKCLSPSVERSFGSSLAPERNALVCGTNLWWYFILPWWGWGKSHGPLGEANGSLKLGACHCWQVSGDDNCIAILKLDSSSVPPEEARHGSWLDTTW